MKILKFKNKFLPMTYINFDSSDLIRHTLGFFCGFGELFQRLKMEKLYLTNSKRSKNFYAVIDASHRFQFRFNIVDLFIDFVQIVGQSGENLNPKYSKIEPKIVTNGQKNEKQHFFVLFSFHWVGLRSLNPMEDPFFF